jgi:hypothetical protein
MVSLQEKTAVKPRKEQVGGDTEELVASLQKKLGSGQQEAKSQAALSDYLAPDKESHGKDGQKRKKQTVEKWDKKEKKKMKI